MSSKLATQIKDSAIPGKWKRIAEAYAAFANNDGTNIYPSKEKLGKKAGCGPDTVYRQTPDLLACGLLSHAQTHTCRVENCNKGAGNSRHETRIPRSLEVSSVSDPCRWFLRVAENGESQATLLF